MIIYGSRSKALKSEMIAEKCPNCQNSNSILMAVFQRYAHIFWIPFFPVGKTGVSQCTHCKQVLQKKQFPSSFTEKYNAMKSDSQTPWWTFAGLAIVVILIIVAIVSGKQNDKRNAEMILQPKKGDVYEIKNDYTSYTLAKVDRVAGDIVYIRFNQYETNKVSGLTDLKNKGESAYSEKIIPMLKRELKQLLEEGKIMDIDRK